MIYTTMRTHARRLANDPNSSVVDADVLGLAQDVYTSYWESFLKDRLLGQSNFVTFAANEYIAKASVACRDVHSLVKSVAFPQASTSNPILQLERDDFDAVCADVDNYPDQNGVVAQPKRWGVRMETVDNAPLIAIWPATTGITLAAYTYPLRNTLSTASPAGDLQGDDTDGYAVARLVACEIMLINGEDPADIAGVFNLLDQKVQDKYQGIIDRAKPRSAPGKVQ